MYLLASKYPSCTESAFFAENSDVHRPVSSDELDLFMPKGKWKFGTYCHTMVIDTGYHLPWALAKFQRQGGHVEQGRVEHWAELEGR